MRIPATLIDMQCLFCVTVHVRTCLPTCRLSTVVNCDKILVLEDGAVVESGTHSELLAKPASKYAGSTPKLTHVQFVIILV